jgi:hypothetical protein
MVWYFVGGALGSATASWLYGTHRWAGVCVLGAGIGAAAVALALIDAARHRERPAGAVLEAAAS